MVFLARLVPTAALLALLAFSTGCRRPGQSLADDHPGIEPKPSGRALGENLPMPDPERPTIDLSRPESKSQDIGLLAADDLVYDAAMRGEAWAQTRLGEKYVKESDDPDRRQEGIELLQGAAAKKDAEALYFLAGIAAAGLVPGLSSVDAPKLLLEAAQLGNADAQFDLAAKLAGSAAGPESAEDSLLWLRKAALQGHAPARHAAAISLLRRASNQRDIDEGLALLEKAAAQNHRESLMVLAGVLTRGEFGLAKDQARAESLLKPRAEQGDHEIQFGLATLYIYGDQMVGKKEEGMMWLRTSAEAGFAKSAELLGEIGQGRDEDKQSKQPGLFRLGGRVELKKP